MSFFDSVTKLAEGFSSSGDHAAVASGLMQELGGSGGVAGLIQSFHQNGAGGLVQQFASGQTQGVDPSSIEQAVGGSGLIDNIAQRTGVPADSVRSSLATIIPMLVNHVTANGHVTTDGQPTDNPPPDTGSLLQSVLGKLL
ncbi:MAG TPA: YidB family protein [Terracidiphilus sp.]